MFNVEKTLTRKSRLSLGNQATPGAWSRASHSRPRQTFQEWLYYRY